MKERKITRFALQYHLQFLTSVAFQWFPAVHASRTGVEFHNACPLKPGGILFLPVGGMVAQLVVMLPRPGSILTQGAV